MTELTHLLGCELTPVEKSLIGYGESRGMRAEQERIIKLLEDDGAICVGHWAHSCQDVESCKEYDPNSRQIHWHGKSPCEAHYMGGDCDHLIELIKGKNK